MTASPDLGPWLRQQREQRSWTRTDMARRLIEVVASADCGFSSQATYWPETRPTIVWAKFEALAAGAHRATARLW